ncbi:MAG: PAS domain S-box protein, partial [Bacteroidales bacterium]
MKKRFLLRGSEEKFRSLIENMGEGVGFLNPDETFDFANPSAEKIFGVGKGGLKGLCLHEFLLDETIDVIKKETKKRSEGMNSTYELEIFLKDGSKKDILVT